LCVAVAALGTAFLIKKKQVPANAAQTLQIITEPEDAAIVVNGSEIESGSTFAIALPDKDDPATDGSLIIKVSKSGFEDWTRTLTTSSLKTPATIYVDLNPE
ncbi:MAG: hypothetical protein JKY56_03015, partial [Kofleriaceae bacterium]|nr:hypothetical protein [Kofleriaceae bacterium]